INYPSTNSVPQEDNYFGQIIADPYRWLEDSDNEKIVAWIGAQNKVTEQYLSAIPYRSYFLKRLKTLMGYTHYSIPKRAGRYWIYFKHSGLNNQPMLMAKEGSKGQEELLIDPNKEFPEGTTTIIETELSKNQKYLAYSLSAAGSDWQEIRLMDFSSRQPLVDVLKHIKFSPIC